MRLVLFTAVLGLTPIIAQAACTGSDHQASMTCSDGSTYDKDSQRCVPTTG
ncbi:hypothetical protein [Palleronia caenipelagi]|uniref:hypothetical protein n=1 Tax=Palleronia caenipelagi TaxID=2489174 RepID=UPI00163D52B6|nr:hypothetical protein [Palleronia caenipelagi]